MELVSKLNISPFEKLNSQSLNKASEKRRLNIDVEEISLNMQFRNSALFSAYEAYRTTESSEVRLRNLQFWILRIAL